MIKYNNTWRRELKFIVSEYSEDSIISLIKSHPIILSEIYKERKINNIYFDTIDFKNFSDNVIGLSNRLKIRIRWYGETFTTIKNPILEFKIKNGLVGQKEYFELEQFNTNEYITSKEIYNELMKNKTSVFAKQKLLLTKPVLINNYLRRYFISSCKKFRVTFDKNLNFYSFLGKKRRLIKTKQNILEIKYDKNEMINSGKITNYFPFRLSKSSKYVTGINLLTGLPNIY